MSQNSQTLAIQLEYVRPVLPMLIELESTTFSMMESRPAQKVSTRTARIPMNVAVGGNTGAMNFDGGNLGRGSIEEFDYGQVTPLGIKIASEVTKLAEYATNDSSKAVADIAKRAMANVMKVFRHDLDGYLNTAGNGVLGTISSGGGTTTWTLSNTPFGARLLRKNLPVSVYNSTLTTKRGEATINSNPVRGLGRTPKVTVDVDPGTSNTDVILPSGLTGASPVWLYGIPYFHNSAATGSVLGISRTNDYARANGVDANNSAFSIPPFRLAINQIVQELGDEGLSAKLTWHTHPAAIAGLEEYGLQVSHFIRPSGGGEKIPDFAFNGQDVSICGYPVKRSIHADPTRFDLLNLDSWFRVEWLPIDFVEFGGDIVFPAYGSDGAPAAAYLFYVGCGMQFANDNPKSLSSVINVGLPTGYSV